MDTIPPALADAFDLLRDDLHSHLDEADKLATKTGQWSRDDLDSARKLIPELVTMIRGLVVEHRPQPSGACQICGSTWPCPVVTTVHALVKDPDREFVALAQRAHERSSYYC
ncbi:MAG TPA: hypothetical protein VFO16_12135 [Pseudonocardiaceae bacterium]|nr:hypothetical protein [Pseudonocardiaceae bacterium]